MTVFSARPKDLSAIV